MKEFEPKTSHINTFSQQFAELSSEGLNFEEEIKALAVLLSLPASWEVFYAMFTNSSLKLSLDEAIGTILSGDIRRRLMGLCIDDSVEAEFSAQTTQSGSQSKSRPKRRENKQRSKSRSGRLNAF